MAKLFLKDGGAYLGTIGKEDVQLMIDQLEEEYENDTDYYVTPMTIDLLEENGASPDLIRILRDAVGDSEGVEIVWKK